MIYSEIDKMYTAVYSLILYKRINLPVSEDFHNGQKVL